MAEPVAEFHYTSYGYNLLGAAIEGASGMSYGDYMRKKIWQPMGMSSTRMDDPHELIPNRVRGYRMRGGRLENADFIRP